MIIRLLFVLIIFHFYTPLSGASRDTLKIVLSEFEKEDENFSETLDELAENPVNINSTTASDWKRIPFLTTTQIDSIIFRHTRNGPFNNALELKAVLGDQTYTLIKPYLSAKPPVQWNASIIQTNLLMYPENEAISNGTWLGNPLVNTTRIRAGLGSGFQFGFIAAKDAGEPELFDRTGGFVAFTAKKWRWIIGDFKTSTGSGLLFANPYGNAKSRLSTLSFRSGSYRIAPSLSRSWTLINRGIFIELKPSSRFAVCGFQSLNRRDASLAPGTDAVIGISTNTYHRSAGELERRERIAESQNMALVSWAISDHTVFDFTYMHVEFQPGFRHTFEVLGESKRRALYAFSGKSLSLYSLSYNLDYRPAVLSGECAFSEYSGPAFSNSAFFKHKTVQLGLRHWHVPPAFQSPCGQSFDNSAGFPRGVSGWYLAAQIKPGHGLYLNGYRILKKDLWRGYFDPLPTHTTDWLVASEIRQRGRILSLLLRSSVDEIYDKTDSNQTISSFLQTRQARIDLTVRISENLDYRSRWEVKWRPDGKGTGTNMFQNIRFRFANRFDLNTRVSFFRTPEYRLRIYEYENDLPFVFSNYPLYGTGHKYYILINWPWKPSVQLSGKWRYLGFDDGTGSRITRDFKVMVRWEGGKINNKK